MKQGYWAIVTYEAGPVGEKCKYFIPGEVPPRSERKRKSDLRKIRQNENNAVRRTARILNQNFPWNYGYCIRLTFSQKGIERLNLGECYDPENPEQWDRAWTAARHQLELYILRCQRACKRHGIELRYVAFVSDMRFDGKLQEHVHTRVHCHIVVNPETLEICLSKWSLGSCDEQRLTKEADHTDLAKYLLDQVRRIEGQNKYIPSRSLRKPKESAPRLAPTAREVQPPKGAQLLYRAPYEPGRPQYIRYILPRADE